MAPADAGVNLDQGRATDQDERTNWPLHLDSRMRKPAILITGASGEMGTGLIERLGNSETHELLTLDLAPLDDALAAKVSEAFTGDILDQDLLDRIMARFEVEQVYHLAALLSTRAEFSPDTAHRVNVDGTISLLNFAMDEATSHGRPVKFFYPSSIAVFGMPDLATKAERPRVKEYQWNEPTTMYGCNKLYCEHLGRYYSDNYKQMAAESFAGRIDFRCIRFPGLISAVTMPTGGTSDYTPEMLHAAAKGEPYASFVREDTTIPFMTMPDAVDAILGLMDAPAESLTRRVYNITAFSASAARFRDIVVDAFPAAEISFAPDEKRQAIVDSWPADVDDAPARADFGLSPRHDLDTAFAEYLIPTIRARYES